MLQHVQYAVSLVKIPTGLNNVIYLIHLSRLLTNKSMIILISGIYMVPLSCNHNTNNCI